MLALVVDAALAFAPTPTPSKAPLLLRSAIATPTMPARFATAAVTLANIPSAALAEDGDIVDTVINGVLSVVVLGFIAFIGSYLFKAVGEVGNTLEDRAEYDREMNAANPGRKQSVKQENMYDDSGSGAVSEAEIQAEIEYRKKNGSGSKQVLSGKRVAPWMNIDENMVEQYKAKKLAERKKRQAGLGGK